MKKNILFKVNASAQTGFGHFRRSMSLAQILKEEDHTLHLQTNSDNPLLANIPTQTFLTTDLLPDELGGALDWKLLKGQIQAHAIDWIVLDGYEYTESYEKWIADEKIKLLRIDDYPRYQYWADVLLCQNFGARDFVFETHKPCFKALGLNYFLVPQELRSLVKADRFQPSKLMKITISLGGATEYTKLLTPIFSAFLKTLDPQKFKVSFIVTDPDDHAQVAQTLKGFVAVEILAFQKHLGAALNESDFVFTTPGTTMWELVYLMVPFAVIPLNEAQGEYCKTLHADGVCYVLPSFPHLKEKNLANFFHQTISDERALSLLKAKYQSLMSRDLLITNLKSLIY
ncbi:MAG: hypothetical protein ACOYL6_02765 [Bacteriovoracaceae bacterium]